MQLIPNEASYNLTIDSQTPIQMIILQSDVPVDIFSTLKQCPVKDKPTGCMLLTTFVIDSQDQRRVSLKMRTSEGRNGVLTAMVLSYGEKTAIALEIPIKALNLHTRLQVSDN